MRKLILSALGAVLLATPGRAVAQLPHFMPAGSPWIDVNYPKLFWTPTEGLTAGGYLAFIRELNLEAADSPAPYAGAIAINGQVSTSGSRELLLEGRFPALAPGWRFVTTFSAARRARANYFGIGNSTTYDDTRVIDTQKHFYQALDHTLLARGEVQRRVAGGLRLLAGIHAEQRRLSPLPGPSVLAADLAALADPTIGANTADVTVRGGLVLDMRDDEPAPNRGVLLEAIHAVTVGGDMDYTRTTLSAAGYATLGEKVELSARAMGQVMGRNPRLLAYYLVEGSDRSYTGLGGPLSHRALAENRFLGRDKVLLNLDLRYHAVNVERAARATLLFFFDAGRVFEGEQLRISSDGLKLGGGAGLFLQIGRAGIIGGTVGEGPDGVVLNVSTRWAY